MTTRLYDYFHPLLEEYTDLIIKLNSTCSIFEEVELAEFFSEETIKGIISMNKEFSNTLYKRSCGNPLFTHSFRTSVWLNACNCSNKVVSLGAYHDFLEDLCSSFNDFEEKLSIIPQNEIEEVLTLTNRYTFLYKYAKKNKLSKEEFLSLLKELKTHNSFSDCVDEIYDLVNSRNIELLGQEGYNLYLEKIIDFFQSRNKEDVLLVKLVDRIDNTLSDMPSKFTSILKLYNKNELLLRLCKPLVEKGVSLQCKIFYAILIERSIRQINFIKKNYEVIISRRGKFYGNQYQHLYRQLWSIEAKFEPYKEFLKDLSFKELFEKLQKEIENNKLI
jgi:hypothetical protein